MQQTNSRVDPVSSHTGAIGYLPDFQAKGSENTSSFCALIAARNLNEVNPMISQLQKNDELVILMNQFSTSVPLPMKS